MHFICRSFIGKNTPNLWSQYWENEPDDQLKLTKGHLFGLINLQNLKSVDQTTIGHDLIFEINQQYFSQNSSDINTCLKNTLTSISQNPIFLNYQIDLILTIVLNQQVFLATFGQGHCILQRKSQISHLLTGNTNEIFQINGPIQDNDRLLLISHQFFQNISWNKIKTILIETKIQNIEENFLSLLYSVDNQDLLSSVLIEIHEDTEIIENMPQVQPQPIINEDITTPPLPDKKNFSDSIFVRHQSNSKINQHKKIQILIALFLIIGLIVSFYFGYQKNKSLKAESEFRNLKSELENKLNNISILRGMNFDSAFTTAKEAQKIISDMASLKIHPNEITQYQSQIETILSQTGDSENFSPQMIQDTSLIVNQPSFSKITFYQNNLYLLESTKGRLDIFNPKEKSTKNIIIADSIKLGKKILFDNNNIYIYKENQLYQVNKDNLTLKIDFSSLETPLTISDIQFWNGSLYILDSNLQSIWKLTPSLSSFSSPQLWLKNNLKLELGSQSIAIDGRIWILTQSGQINLYNSGLNDNFKPNQSINITKATNLNTHSESDFLIFIDDSKYIVVYKKSGELNSKYNLGQLKLIDLTFDSQNKIIYFLASDQKIYKITL